MRELDFLKDKRDVNLCSTMALMLAHKKGNTVGELENGAAKSLILMEFL